MDFLEAKQKKKRGYTVSEALEDAQSGQFEEIVIAGIGTDGYLKIFYSTESILGTIGVLEVMKQQMLDEMRE